jgi:DNA repair ATPase RecN
MTTEEKPSMFESLRNSIKLIGDDPKALENVEKGLCKLETKFTKYAQSMTEVLRIHSQMKTEIDNLNETITKQENEILSAKTDSDKAKVLVTKLKREKIRLKKRSRKSKNLQKPTTALNEKEPSNNNHGYGDVIPERKDTQGTTENLKN